MAGRWRLPLMLMSLGIAAMVLTMIPIALPFSPAIGSDFGGFYAAAQALRLAPQTANIYDQPFLAQTLANDPACRASWTLPHPYPFPYAFTPLLAVLLEPLTHLLPCGDAYHVWLLGNYVIWIGCLALVFVYLYRAWAQFGGRGLALSVVVGLLILRSILIAFMLFGQIFVPVLFLLLLAYWLLPKHPVAAGAFLAFAALLQVFPGLLLVYLLFTRTWRALWGAALVSAASLVLMIAFAPASLLAAPLGILHSGSFGVQLPWNQALWKVPFVGGLLVASVLIIWVMLTLRERIATRLGYSWTILTALLITPFLQIFYLIWLIPPLMALATTQKTRISYRTWLAFSVYLVLSSPFVPKDFTPWVPLALVGLWMLTGYETHMVLFRSWYYTAKKSWLSKTLPSAN